jgi:hypothetical protein
MTRLRMTIPPLDPKASISRPLGTRVWLDGQEHNAVAVELSGGVDGPWQAKITFNVALEGIVQEEAPASLGDACNLLKVREPGR